MENEVVANGNPRIAPRERAVNLLIKLLVTAFLIVVCCHLLFSDAAAGSPSPEEDQCDIFSGEWIPDTSGHAYNATCSQISDPQNCLKNGRPDTGYLHWRWEPYDCNLPQSDPKRFLNALRGKSLALIGDSIFRNQMESLLCLLSQVEEAVMVYHDKKFQSKTWFLPSHNVTLGLIWSPFLVESTESLSRNDIQLQLDVLDQTWTSQYHKYNFVVFSGGQWFLKETIFWENNTIVGCHNCPGKNLSELGMDYSYRKALQLTLSFMAASDHKPQIVILRTWSPDHFEYGEWYNGGICNRTRPFKEGEYTVDPVDPIMRRVEIEEFGKNGDLPLKLLDTYHLSLLRPDGHPGPYRRFHPDISKRPQNDCLHWCLPGPIDTWNDLLMEIILNEEELRSAY